MVVGKDRGRPRLFGGSPRALEARAGLEGVGWPAVLGQAEAWLGRSPVVPRTGGLPGRSHDQAAVGNRDFRVVEEAAHRVERAAMVWYLTGREEFREDLWVQLWSLLDGEEWEDWRDLAHLRHPADLRTGQLLRSLGLAYDWMRGTLSDGEKARWVEGMERRGLGPYREAERVGSEWLVREDPNNWMTVIVGGAGIAAMALSEEGEDYHRLHSEASRRMKCYLDVIGPEGEFNESVGYAGSMLYPLLFYAIERNFPDREGPSPLDHPKLERFAYWYLHMIRPPGRMALLGDTNRDTRPATLLYALLASVYRNPVFQWVYKTWSGQGRHAWLDLLWCDPTLEAVSPEGLVPRAAAYEVHGACWASRTSWDPVATASLVYGKGGRGYECHGHHDIGSICVDGWGEELITEPGNLAYPADYFGPHRYEYYNAAAAGHNLVIVNQREMVPSPEARARLLQFDHDPDRGTAWSVDSTALYPDAVRVVRTVHHTFPDQIEVVDEVEVDTGISRPEVRLRWHPAVPVDPPSAPDDPWQVVVGGVRLTAQVTESGGLPCTCSAGRHAYQPPYHLSRIGSLLEQRREPYLDWIVSAHRVRFVTQFRIDRP